MNNWSEPKSNYVASDEVRPQIFNELAENEKYLKENQDTKISSSQVKDSSIKSIMASTRVNLLSNEKLSVGFGKVRKWFNDIKGLAFKDVITEDDISGTISANKINGTVAKADKANKLTTPRAIGISGVNCTAVNFDGSSNVTLVITGIPSNLLMGIANINTTGNADSATKLKTKRSIGLSGVSAIAKTFDGTGNIVIPITAVPVSLLTGVIAKEKLPTATANAKGAVKGGGNVSIRSDGTMNVNSSGSNISVTARSGLGNYTNLDDVLYYISEVFRGNKTITKIKANTFDTN